MDAKRLITVHGRKPGAPDWTWCGQLLAHVYRHHWHVPRVELLRCRNCERAAQRYYRSADVDGCEPEDEKE